MPQDVREGKQSFIPLLIMKVKALRKKDTKEFVVMDFNENFKCLLGVYTTEVPKLQPVSATMEHFKMLHAGYDLRGYDFEDFEYAKLDVFDGDMVGADIRNKLTPFNSMIDLHGLLKKRMDKEKKDSLKRLLEKVIEQSRESIEYLKNLL
jgi:hypothetical protein